MKQGIHPEYKTTTVVCACGNRIETKSTQDGEIHVEICSVCHPFYTGKQRLVDTAGRVERFKRKYGDTGSGAAGADEAGSPAAEEEAAVPAEPAAEKEDGDQAGPAAEKEPARRPAKVGGGSEEPEEAEPEAAEDEG